MRLVLAIHQCDLAEWQFMRTNRFEPRPIEDHLVMPHKSSQSPHKHHETTNLMINQE